MLAAALVGGLLALTGPLLLQRTALRAERAGSRCEPPSLHAGDEMPMSVVEGQLQALQRGEVDSCFDRSSIAFRRLAGPRQKFEKIVREHPEYKPLVGSKNYTVLSALQVAPRRYRCRVRVENTVGRIAFAVDYIWDLVQASETKVEYDLGQCVAHQTDGHHGIVVGWDLDCQQSDEWCEDMGIDALPRGRAQPFYHVIPDTRDRPDPQLMYLPEEMLLRADIQAIDHPYFRRESFTGEQDEERGVWVPTPHLREQYPLGLEGRWLVERFFLDEDSSGFDA